MDTTATRNGSSLIVYAVGIMALLALVIGIFSLTKAMSLQKQVNEKMATYEAIPQRVNDLDAKMATAATNASAAKTSADRSAGKLVELDRNFGTLTQNVRDYVTQTTTALSDRVTEIESRGGRGSSGGGTTTTASGGAATGPAPGTVAEDGTYVIKTGDYFSKLAKEWGCTIADIEAANPGVDSRRLQVGQKLVVPKPR